MPCHISSTIVPAPEDTNSSERLLGSAFDAKSNKMARLSDRAEMSLIVIRVVTSLYNYISKVDHFSAIILSWRICSRGRR